MLCNFCFILFCPLLLHCLEERIRRISFCSPSIILRRGFPSQNNPEPKELFSSKNEMATKYVHYEDLKNKRC